MMIQNVKNFLHDLFPLSQNQLSVERFVEKSRSETS